ncbi:tape measure protein [Chryseobacterium scophthalmum]|uniref:tape measure protein n=1 Tax=Chryseobacterium scophthalmum TaxID=59733 RepID=UPI000C9DE934|nr:tape measure protein [Chryseobacterium scophthalmum]
MSNIVEFIVKMKDMMSSDLLRLAAASRSSFNNISTTAQNAFNRVSTASQSTFRRVQSSARNTFNSISQYLSSIALNAQSAFNRLLSSGQSAFNRLRTSARNTFSSVTQYLSNSVTTGNNTYNRLLSSGRSAFSRLRSYARNSFLGTSLYMSNVASTAPGTFGRLLSAGRSAFSRLSTFTRSAFTNLKSTARNAFSGITQVASRFGTAFTGIMQRTVVGSAFVNLFRGARAQFSRLRQYASGFFPNRSGGEGAGSSGGSGGGSGRSSGGGALSVGGMAVGNMLGGFALNAATAFLDAVKNGIGAAISGSMQKEKDLVGLSTFIGEKGAQDAYKNIRKDAEVTPFDTASLLKVNRALISSGLSAKDAREDTMNLANAISATGGGNDELMRMAINMQQIKSLGKASAMDIKQFGYAGINIYKLLEKATGKSADEVKNMDVSYDLLAKSLAMARSEGGLYPGALEKMGKTMSGKWEQIKDRAANALTDIGDAFSPVIIKILDVAIKMSSYVAPLLAMAKPYIDAISAGLGVAIDYVMNMKNTTGGWMDFINIGIDYLGTIWEILKSAGMSVFKILSGIAQWVWKSEIIKDVFRLIGWILEKVIKPVIGWLGDALVWIWENVLKPILDGLETAYKWVKEMIGASDNTLTIEVKKTSGKPKPEAPGEADPTSYFADLTRFKDLKPTGEDDKDKNKKKSKEKGDIIGGGGTKYITINLGKFFDNIQFTTMNMKESEQDIERILMECMGRVLYNGSKNG